MAFSSINRIKLKNLAVKNKRARLALKMLDIYDKMLSTVLVGNNFANIAASSLATALFISLLGENGVSVATAVMTVLVMIFGDISPKTLAKEIPELTALRAAPVLRVFIFILTPVNFLLTQWKKLLVKIFHVSSNRATTEAELLTFVEEVRQEGGINSNEEQMIRQAIGFDELKVTGVFTPRFDVEAVSLSSSIEEIDQKFIDTGFSRLPVFQDTIDNIKGIIILKDFYLEVMKGQKTIEQIIKPVVFINKTIKVAKLLRTMQEKQAHLAVVVDEHGGTLGIVTIEDIIEELVEVVKHIEKNDNNSYNVLGTVNFAEMLKTIALESGVNNEHDNDTDEIPDTTVANWIMENLGRLPRVGEKLTWRYLTIQASKVLRQRVMEVIVSLNEPV